MAKVGKRLKQAKEMVDVEKTYSLDEALDVISRLPKAKFDESVDMAVKLGVDPRKADENVRGMVSLPNGTGKSVRVVVFCKGELIKEAEDAGADYAGADDLVDKIKGGWLDFDAAIATPDMMAQVGRIGKILGPRGVMPNPKLGTVTRDVKAAVEALKAGRVEYRVEKAGIVHVGVGRASFDSAKLKENVTALMEAVMKAKPKTSKGVYLKDCFISTTMGPGLKIDAQEFRNI